MVLKTRKLKKNRQFWPKRYYSGLTYKQKLQRKKEINTRKKIHWNDPRAYQDFKTNTLGKPKTSRYTKKWRELFPDSKSLKSKSSVTGVPLNYITEVYNRGLAAWRTGHRSFASQGAWGIARVHSFLLCGKTHYTADSDLVRKARAESASARKWFKRCSSTKTQKKSRT